jgi:caffeoyl-CoA O-methyltransferase
MRGTGASRVAFRGEHCGGYSVSASRKYSEKLLPNQEFFSYLYEGSKNYEEALYDLNATFVDGFDYRELDLKYPTEVGFEEMSTPPYQLSLFAALIAWRGVKSMLEIGTFIGHSSMRFVEMMGPDSRLDTIEVFSNFAEIAQENFRRNGFEDSINLHQGNAEQIIENLDGPFDLVFVDGSKQSYLDLIQKSIPHLSENGMILVDDVFFHGDALNDTPSTEKGAGCKAVLDHFAESDQFRRLLLPIGNGLLVLY